MQKEDRNVVPREIQGWNWGACLLGGIWAIGNGVWIGLLAFIPYVGMVMCVVLAVKGNEWAWRSRRWENIEHFKRTQKTWVTWGIITAAAGMVVFVLIVVYMFYSLLPILT